MPVSPCAVPAHLKDVSRQSCSSWSLLLISSCPQNCWSFEKCSQTSLVFGSAKTSWRWTHTAQALSFMWGGNPGQFSSWTPPSTTANPLDRTDLPHLSSLPAPGSKNNTSGWLQLPVPAVQVLPSNSLIPFSFLVRGCRSCSSETKLQKSTMAEKADKEPKKFMQGSKWMCFHRGPRTKMRM